MTLTKHEPKKVVGTVNAAEFTVAVCVDGLPRGREGSQIPLGGGGLIIGGLIVAPFAARFAGRAPVHSLGTLVGGMVIISNLAMIFKIAGVPGASAVRWSPWSRSSPSRWRGGSTRWT